MHVWPNCSRSKLKTAQQTTTGGTAWTIWRITVLDRATRQVQTASLWLDPQTGTLCINHRIRRLGITTHVISSRTLLTEPSANQCFSGQHKERMVASSSSLREEEEEVQDRPAGGFYPESARQAGDTEKCLQGSRSVKFLCQVAPRREVPYARGPEPRPGCEKLRGCFCMACRQSIPPSWRALQGCLAHCLERGLAQVLNMGRAKV